MKKILLVFAVLFTVALAFVGCQDLDYLRGEDFVLSQDSSEYVKPGETVAKRLIRHEMHEYFNGLEDESEIHEFVYDSLGRLMREGDDTYAWYGTDSIVINDANDYYGAAAYFANGLVTEYVERYNGAMIGAATDIYYNADNRPYLFINSNDYDADTTFISWENDKIVGGKVDWSGMPAEYVYEYGNVKGNYFLFFYDFLFENIEAMALFAHPELCGLQNMTDLPVRIIGTSGGYQDVTDLAYEFDEDGYIKKCTLTTVEKINGVEADTYTTTYDYTWETIPNK